MSFLSTFVNLKKSIKTKTDYTRYIQILWCWKSNKILPSIRYIGKCHPVEWFVPYGWNIVYY